MSAISTVESNVFTFQPKHPKKPLETVNQFLLSPASKRRRALVGALLEKALEQAVVTHLADKMSASTISASNPETAEKTEVAAQNVLSTSGKSPTRRSARLAAQQAARKNPLQKHRRAASGADRRR